MQRYHRLQVEIQELANDTNSVSDQLKSSDPKENLTPEQFSALTQGLSQQLNSMRLEELFGPNADVDMSSREAVVQKYVSFSFYYNSCFVCSSLKSVNSRRSFG